jgi:hypothetical protein
MVNEKMPYVLKAWEMKADGKDKRTISKYLSGNDIKIGNTFERYFRTMIYTGYHPDPET